MEDFSVQTANINEKWLQNIYENIKKMEEHERLSREGCEDLLDYIRIPSDQRKIIIGSLQYKNLNFLITEFNLLLTDLSPVVDSNKVKSFRDTLETIENALPNITLFIEEKYDLNGRLTETMPTPFFFQTIKALNRLKGDLFREIKGILYINTKND